VIKCSKDDKSVSDKMGRNIKILMDFCTRITASNLQRRHWYHQWLQNLVDLKKNVMVLFAIPHSVDISLHLDPFLRPWAWRWINHWSLQCMICMTPDPWLPSRPKKIIALSLVPKIILLGNRGTRVYCINDLSNVAIWKRNRMANNQTCDLWVASPTL